MGASFSTQFGNQRNILIPPVPTTHQILNVTAVGTTVVGVVTLTANLLTNNSVHAYAWYYALKPAPTAAASSVRVAFQWQFRDAAHALLGASTTVDIMSASSGAAGQPLSAPPAMPGGLVPAHIRLVPPATSAEIVGIINVLSINGAPSCDCTFAWGIDITNNATPGDIGGSGIAAQSTTSPNAF